MGGAPVGCRPNVQWGAMVYLGGNAVDQPMQGMREEDSCKSQEHQHLASWMLCIIREGDLGIKAVDLDATTWMQRECWWLDYAVICISEAATCYRCH